MEFAITINRINDLKHWNTKYKRLYIGNEFCPRLLPGDYELRKIIEFANNQKLKISLMIGYTDCGSFNNVIGFLNSFTKGIADEVIVNDWGVYQFVKENTKHKIVIGRVLSKFLAVHEKKTLDKLRISRLEFNDYKFAKTVNFPNIANSIYYPYLFIGATRYCPFVQISNNISLNPGILNCTKECLNYKVMVLKNKDINEDIYLKGNALFIKAESITCKNINRIIYEPEIPI